MSPSSGLFPRMSLSILVTGCPKPQFRFDIDLPSNLLVLIQVFNSLQETGKGPACEREDLHDDLCIMGIRKRHRPHSFVNVPKGPGSEVESDPSLCLEMPQHLPHLSQF